MGWRILLYECVIYSYSFLWKFKGTMQKYQYDLLKFEIFKIYYITLTNNCKNYYNGFEIIICIPVRVYFNSSEYTMLFAHAQKPSFLIDAMTIDIDTKLIKLSEIYVVEQYTYIHKNRSIHCFISLFFKHTHPYTTYARCTRI
jgi:hypothetical protein